MLVRPLSDTVEPTQHTFNQAIIAIEACLLAVWHLHTFPTSFLYISLVTLHGECEIYDDSYQIHFEQCARYETIEWCSSGDRRPRRICLGPLGRMQSEYP